MRWAASCIIDASAKSAETTVDHGDFDRATRATRGYRIHFEQSSERFARRSHFTGQRTESPATGDGHSFGRKCSLSGPFTFIRPACAFERATGNPLTARHGSPTLAQTGVSRVVPHDGTDRRGACRGL